jgi:hypothetical protein
MCFVSFLFDVGSYVKYRSIYIYSISQYVIVNFLYPDSQANELARAFK